MAIAVAVAGLEILLVRSLYKILYVYVKRNGGTLEVRWRWWLWCGGDGDGGNGRFEENVVVVETTTLHFWLCGDDTHAVGWRWRER